MNTDFSVKEDSKYLAIGSIVLMLVGFFFSRMLSSAGIIFGGVYLLIHLQSVWQLINKDRWVTLCLLLSISTFLSDVWHSIDAINWGNAGVKLQLILYVLLIFVFRPSRKQMRQFHFFFMAMVFIACIYSLFGFYFSDGDILDDYKRAKVMKVLAYGDHIRMSWMCVIAVIIALYESKREDKKIVKVSLMFFISFLIVFLHILTAKTGLLLLYGSFGIWIFYQVIAKRNKKYLVILPLIVLLPIIAYQTLPSFKNRVDFVRYDFLHYSQGEYRPGLSDALRYYSIISGIETINRNFWTGVGYNNLPDKTAEWYEANQPKVPREDQFLPSSQYIIYWASGGVFCFFILLLHCLYPFWRKEFRRNKYFMMFFVPAILSFTFETHLEGQLSIYVYGFFLSWFLYLALRDSSIVAGEGAVKPQ